MQTFWRDTGRTRASQHYVPWGIAAAEAALGAMPGDSDADALDAWRLRADRLFWLLLHDGSTYRKIGAPDEAVSRCERALKLARQVQSRINEGAALDGLGFIAQARGQLVQAEAYYTQSLAIRREVQDRQGEGVDLYSLALIAEAHDDIDRAEALHRESLAIGIEVQDWLGVADSYSTLGEFLITQRGKREEGCTMLAEAARLYDQMGVSSGDDARETAQRLGCGTEGGGATS